MNILIVEDQFSLADAMKIIHKHGQDRRYHHIRMGLNSRLDTLQAAVLLAKLEIFGEEVKRREEIGKRYTELFQGIPGVTPPYIAEGNTSVYAQYTIRTKSREKLRSQLEEAGVPTAVHYPIPLNMQPMFDYLPQKKGSVPVAERAAEEVLSLPMSAWTKIEDIKTVVGTIRKCL